MPPVTVEAAFPSGGGNLGPAGNNDQSMRCHMPDMC